MKFAGFSVCSRTMRLGWRVACMLSWPVVVHAQMIEELPLRALAPAGTPSSAEVVTFRTGKYDDRGFNRTIHDIAVPPQNSELLAAALREHQVPVELLLVATGRHGFALGRDPESARWKDAFLTWLDRLP